MCTGLTEKLIGVLVMLLKYFNTNYIIQRELVNMSKKYSSFEKDEIRFDNWRKFLNEQEDLFEEGDEKPKKEKVEEGICKTGYYWCESAGGCINEKIPCKEKI